MFLVATPPPAELLARKPWWLARGSLPSICGACKPAAPRSRISASNPRKPDEYRSDLVQRMACSIKAPKGFVGGLCFRNPCSPKPPMNTLGSWATDRSSAAGRPQWPGRRVRMVVAPLSSLLMRVESDTVHCLKQACADRSLSRILLKGISRTKSRGRRLREAN